MRKLKVAALMLATAVVFTACGKKDNNENTPSPTPTEVVSPTDMAEPTPEGSDGSNVGGNEEGMPALPEVSEELENLHNEVVKFATTEIYGEEYGYAPDMSYDKTAISELFGVSEDWYDYALAEGTMISMHVDTFVAIHAKEGNLENVQNALNNYRDVLINDTMQYPMNQLKIQGSKVFTHKDYVFFIMLGFVDDSMLDAEEDTAIAEYEKMNQKVIDKITSVLGE